MVVRTEFAKEHAAELKCFLDEYRASVEALSADVQGTAEKIQETGIFCKGRSRREGHTELQRVLHRGKRYARRPLVLL